MQNKDLTSQHGSPKGIELGMEDLEKAKKTWELSKQLGLIAKHENEAVPALISRRRPNKDDFNHNRWKKYKGRSKQSK